MSPNHAQFFSKYIQDNLGIVYSDFNQFQLQNRLEEIVRILGLKDVEDLYQKSKFNMSTHIKQLLIDMATNNETSFFRDPKIFKAVGTLVLPELVKQAKAGKKVRIWSAATSFGQEPYSLAIQIHEACPDPVAFKNFEIIGTDISSRAIERAQTGRYSQLEVQRGLSAPLMIKYFEKDKDDFWTVKPHVRERVKCGKQNLLEPFAAKGFDMIFVRNVLIYQNVDNKKMILKKIIATMNEGAHLILGAGESLIGLNDDVQTVKGEDALLYQLKPAAQRKAA